jgi:hypothetical protein
MGLNLQIKVGSTAFIISVPKADEFDSGGTAAESQRQNILHLEMDHAVK